MNQEKGWDEECLQCGRKIPSYHDAYLTHKNGKSGFMHKLCYCILHENDNILTKEELEYLKQNRGKT